MKIYLVGGAVRDAQMGIPFRERDWCVVGAEPDELKKLGYRPVGKDFPVFLHPESGEEYALARTERKTSAGYRGFAFHTSPDVTIEDDLKRRDLTINAIAQDDDGQLIDPVNGLADIHSKTLRHVSDAFAEDPVRILRTAKFAARFNELGFEIAPETSLLMRQMVTSGEAEALVPDRVWKETEAALVGPKPRVFFEVLRSCGALAVVFPELDALFGIPQPEKWHPEVDCGLHMLMTLEQSAILSDHADVRFAALVHDLGKASTDPSLLPKHHGHERRSVQHIKQMAKRLPVPSAFRDLALLVAEFHGHCHKVFELKHSTILKVMNRVDAFRRPERFEKFLMACEADARGRTGLEERPYPQAAFMRDAHLGAMRVDTSDLTASGLSGMEIGDAISKRRQGAIAKFAKNYEPPK